MPDNTHVEGLRIACPWCGLQMLGNREERCCVTHGWFEIDIPKDFSSVTFRPFKIEAEKKVD